jgi:hypothetical protein
MYCSTRPQSEIFILNGRQGGGIRTALDDDFPEHAECGVLGEMTVEGPLAGAIVEDQS